MNRRWRQRFYAATAVLSLAGWLFMTAAETCTPLHAWLHGGSIPDNDDDCAIVALFHGKIETTPCDVPIVITATWVEATPRTEISFFVQPLKIFPLVALLLQLLLPKCRPVSFG
jgi:hypothetical protein